MDIDPERLRIAEIMAHRVAEKLGAHPKISAYQDRKAALEGADYAINMIQVGGYPATLIDFEVPKRYGLQQTIADTLGIGGIFRALRTIPVMLDICRDMEEVCPGVTFLNYVNPIAMNTWAVLQATKITTVGLCHSVQGTAGQLAQYMGIPVAELSYRCAGINHVAFYLELEHKGQDAYPLLREAAQREEIWRRNQAQNLWWEQMRQQLLDGTADFTPERSNEYAALIIHSMETNTPRVIYGNVLNRDLITNLPQGCCVEVPCLVDRNGIQPTVIGVMPLQLAALQSTNVNVQGLVVEAILTGKKE